MSGRIYFYKLTVDNGGAPCVADRLLSLAICKPMIRSTAREGDWIFGFGSNGPDMANRLIYIARVTDKLTDGKYYKRPDFQERPDSIYEWNNDNRLEWKEGAKYHGPDDMLRDVGRHPSYVKANVLLSEDFRYLGAKGTNNYKKRYPLLTSAVKGLGQGHRINHVEALKYELMRLQEEVRVQYPPDKPVLGPPTHRNQRLRCNSDDPCRTIDMGRTRCL